jgi:rod shape-determining protein MreB and related proteins
LPGSDIGLDLGTATILINVKGKGIVLKEPSVIAYDKDREEIVAIGTEARRMLGRTPDNIVAVRPLRDGVISNFDLTAQMLKYFIKKVCGNFVFKPRIMICVPAMITEVEERAVYDAAIEAGARRAYLIEEPIAAAIGAGIDITKPCGNMIVDIGGGTTDIAIISLKDTVVSRSLKVAGDKFDEAMGKYVRRKYNMLIGERTAEEIKVEIGCVYPREQQLTMSVKGRCLITGLPKMIDISSEETREAFADVSANVVEAVHSVIERTPPELVGDISQNGIIMTGGGSLVWGLDKLIEKNTGITVRIADDPETCVARGTGNALENIDMIPDGLLYIAKNKRDQQHLR